MALKTNYKDEIPTGGKRKYGIVDSAGNYIYRDVQIVRTNTNTQDGDIFGAAQLNEIGTSLNDYGIFKSEVTKNSGTIDVNRATKLKGYKGGNNLLADFDAISREINFKVDETENIPVANAVALSGYKIFTTNVVVNPAGNDFVAIKNNYGASYMFATNGNWDANNLKVIGTSIQNNYILVHFNKGTTNPVQIHIMGLY